jgi:hypothetical protein
MHPGWIEIMRALKFFGLFLIVFSCIEPYKFVIPDTSGALVVEGFISDKSFAETIAYPSDGRYFSIRLTNTSDVTNVRSTPVLGATIFLLNDNGEQWSYEQSTTKPGVYELLDSAFQAVTGVNYKIQISVDDEVFESSWEAMPETEAPPIGPVGFTETESEKYVVESSENVLRTIKEIETHITVGQNLAGSPIYYRWKFSPMWVYIAPLSPSATRPGYKCWVTGEDYLKTFVLQVDNSGGYNKALFRVPTLRNERLLDDFTVLIQQFSMKENYYFFWKEMYDQNEGNVLMDKPPFNLQGNIQSLSGERKAVGFFGVVKEQATRWYFNISELSYPVENTFKKGCETVYGPGGLGDCPEEPVPAFAACECKYCPAYSFGIAKNVKPSWWRD